MLRRAATVQAAAETYAGLVEVGVGLVPGGGGTMNMLWRALEGVPDGANVDTYELVTQVFKNIALAQRRDQRRGGEGVRLLPRARTACRFDRARQLTEAKARAIGLAESGLPPAGAARVRACRARAASPRCR